MNPPSTFARRVAEQLAAHARNVMPRERGDWARAMRNEIEHVPHDRQALLWAIGCVVASYLERSRTMEVGTFRISRLVLAVEALVCFFPLTWMFGALASRGAYGFTGPLPMDAWFFTMLSVAAIGPIGLVVAFKSAVLGRPRLSGVAETVLCVSAAWTFLAYGGQLLGREWYPDRVFDALGLFVMFALLPVLGAAHLVYVSRTRPAVAA